MRKRIATNKKTFLFHVTVSIYCYWKLIRWTEPCRLLFWRETSDWYSHFNDQYMESPVHVTVWVKSKFLINPFLADLSGREWESELNEIPLGKKLAWQTFLALRREGKTWATLTHRCRDSSGWPWRCWCLPISSTTWTVSPWLMCSIKSSRSLKQTT